MKRTVLAVATAATVLSLSACGGGSSNAAPAPDDGSKSAQSQAATATAAKEMNAKAVTEALKAAGLPVKLSVEFTEDNDPNNLIGRPGQYISKVGFTDSRVDEDEVVGIEKGGVEYGGSVEVFEEQADAEARAEYIQAITKHMPIVAEYTYQDGPIVLRVSRLLKPSEVKAYETALGELS